MTLLNYFSPNLAVSWTCTGAFFAELPVITPADFQTRTERIYPILGSFSHKGNKVVVCMRELVRAESDSAMILLEDCEKCGIDLPTVEYALAELPEVANSGLSLVGLIHTHPAIFAEAHLPSDQDFAIWREQVEEGEIPTVNPFIFGIVSPMKDGCLSYTFFRLAEMTGDWQILPVDPTKNIPGRQVAF